MNLDRKSCWLDTQGKARKPGRIMRSILVYVLATVVVTAPGLALLSENDNPLLRPWRMYGTVGIGAAFGEFRVIADDKISETISLPEVLDHARYREQQLYPGSGAVHYNFASTSTFNDIIAPVCERLEAGQQLEFSGRVAERGHWKSVDIDHARLCGDKL